MKHLLTAAAVSAGLSLFANFSSASAAGAPIGVWIDHSGRGAVEIKPCGPALCGYVVAVKNKNDAKGCGKQIIGGAKAGSSNLWSGGWIYSPERRKTYDVELKPLNDGTLRVVGFAGIRMFSRTMIWKPAPQDLKRCDQPEQVVAAHTDDAATLPIATKTGEAIEPGATSQPAPVDATPKPPSSSEEAPPASTGETSDAAEPQGQDNGADAAAGVDGGPPSEREEGPTLGGLNLERVFTKTKTGKCKIDLPWVKLTVDCNAN